MNENSYGSGLTEGKKNKNRTGHNPASCFHKITWIKKKPLKYRLYKKGDFFFLVHSLLDLQCWEECPAHFKQ